MNLKSPLNDPAIRFQVPSGEGWKKHFVKPRLYQKYKQYEDNPEWAEMIETGHAFLIGNRAFGFTADNLRILNAFTNPDSPTFGDLTQSVMQHSNSKSTEIALKRGDKLVSTSQGKAYVLLQLQRRNLAEKVVQTTEDALSATKPQKVGKDEYEDYPDWSNRLRAASMIWKAIGVFDPVQKDGKVAVPDMDTVDAVEWEKLHPEVIRYYAEIGKWPSKDVEKKLEAGVLINELDESERE